MTGERQEILSRLADLAKRGEWRPYVESHPELRQPVLVEDLCSEAMRLIRVDVRQASAVVDIAAWLSERLQDGALRGRTQRAAANVHHVQGEYKQALEAYRRALALFASADDESEAAITKSSALQTLQFLGHHELVFEWAAEAGDVFRRLGDRLRLARLELNVGSMYFRQDRLSEALQRFESAYDQLLQVGEPEDVALCLRNIATVHITLSNLEEAAEAYKRARDYLEKEDLPVLLAEVDYNVAYLHFMRGEYTAAIDLYRETRRRCELTGDAYHSALCDMDEAEIYLELNLVEEAVRASEAAFKSFDRQGLKYEGARALTFLGVARIREGRTVLGLEFLDQARQIFVSEKNRVWPGLVDLYKALGLFRERRRFEARALARDALELFIQASLPTKSAVCELLLARLCLDEGDLEGAQTVFTSALERLSDYDVPALRSQASFVQGQIEEAAGNFQAALEAYARFDVELRRQSSQAPPMELKISLLEDNHTVYESLVSLLAEGRADTGGGPIVVFDYIEVAKARRLADMMAFRGTKLPPKVAARSSRVQRLRRLREELNWYYRRIDVQEIAQERHSAAEVLELRERSRRAETELAETLRDLESTDREFGSLQSAATGGIEEIRSVLPPQALIVEYYIARDTIYACLLDRDHLEVVPLSLASRVQEIHHQLQRQLAKFRLGAEHVAGHSDRLYGAALELLGQLYDKLLRPLEGRISGRPLIVVPHRFLHYVPFAALYDGERFLVDRGSVSYAPTASVFFLSRAKSTQPIDQQVVVAVPGISPAIDEEAAAATGLLADARLLSGADASIAKLRILAEKSRFVHIASQCTFRLDNPMFSAIRFADGHLNLFDLFGLNLNADLVVVSGSGGGLEELSDGHEWIGLARGLLYAGARSALLAQWDPPRETTARFMSAFYGHLRDRPNRAEALRDTMLELRAHERHPYYWAPFALVGSPL